MWIQHPIPADVRPFHLIVLLWKAMHISEVSGRIEIAIEVSAEFCTIDVVDVMLR